MENAFTAPFYELHGRRELFIDGECTLTEYGDEQIAFICGGHSVRVRGKGLRVALLSAGKSIIVGTINGLDFL